MNSDKDLIIEGMENAPVHPAMAVGAIALNFALKYHDTQMVKDGALYQQYKLEGRNITPLHLDMVFETALRIEEHLLTSQNRITDMLSQFLIEAAAEVIDAALDGEDKP